MSKQLTLEEKLRKEIAHWKDSFESMQDLKNCIKFCHSVDKQKLEYIEKNYPEVFKKSKWQYDISKADGKTSISYAEILMLN